MDKEHALDFELRLKALEHVVAALFADLIKRGSYRSEELHSLRTAVDAELSKETYGELGAEWSDHVGDELHRRATELLDHIRKLALR